MRTKHETEIDFCDGVFFLELVQCINFTESRLGALLPRNPLRTFLSARRLACAAHPALSPPAGCESHDSCPLVCAGSKLNIPPVHPERAASSVAAAGAPRRPIRLVGPAGACGAHDCLPAAGPRATPLTAADHPGRPDCLLVVNLLIVPASLLALSMGGVAVSGCVLWSSRLVPVSG